MNNTGTEEQAARQDASRTRYEPNLRGLRGAQTISQPMCFRGVFDDGPWSRLESRSRWYQIAV